MQPNAPMNWQYEKAAGQLTCHIVAITDRGRTSQGLCGYSGPFSGPRPMPLEPPFVVCPKCEAELNAADEHEMARYLAEG